MTDDNVINFPRIGFTLTPTTGSETLVIEPPNTPTPSPDGAPEGTLPEGRRSPLDIVAALPDPGILQPVTTAPQAAHGQVPDTFRNEPADGIGPRLGALSLAAVLATAVAALRGTHTVLSTWWENRQARQAETDKLREARFKHQMAMQNIGDKAAQQRAKRQVPSSSEFGRKSLGGRSGGSSSGKGSGGSGKKTSPSSGSGTGSGGKKRNSGSGSTGSSAAGGAGRKGAGSGSGSSGTGRDRKDRLKSPHRNSQSAGGGLKKQRRSDSNTGSGSGKGVGKDRKGRTGLGDALAKDTHKKAADRLKRRRKNLDNPALWSGDTKRDKRGKIKDTKRPGKDLEPVKAPGTGKNDGTGRVKTPKNNTQTGRVTLTDAMARAAHKAARKRLKRRRRTITPPVWSAPRNRKTKQAGGQQTPNGTAPSTHGGGHKQAPKQLPPGTGAGTSTGSKGRGRGQRVWSKARAYARKKAATGGCFGRGTATTGPNSSTGPIPGPTIGGNGPRRSPFENAGYATAGDTTTVVEVITQPHPGPESGQPAAVLTGAPALDPAPTPHTERSGTTRPPTPIPMPPARTVTIQEPRTMAARIADLSGRRMSDEHATEITLDDSLDEADEFASDAFKTTDECSGLAKKASALRSACIQLAEILATKHNLIGRLFQGALARFIESMDLVDRMSQEMEMSSLEAAEMAEALSNDLNDAYRPYTQATADAGLTTPSAPIHNKA